MTECGAGLLDSSLTLLLKKKHVFDTSALYNKYTSTKTTTMNIDDNNNHKKVILLCIKVRLLSETIRQKICKSLVVFT